MKHQDALDQLARETNRARRRLALERLLRACLVVAGAVGVWAAVALLGGHERLPPLLQSLSAIFALLLFGYLAVRARREWRAPTEEEARAQLAADSAMDAGAFDALRDQPTRYDPVSVALWNRERERLLENADSVRLGPPRPRLDELDPYKLRYVLVVLLIGAFVVAGAQSGDRLARAFLPDPGPLLGDQEMAIEAWVAPAEYTRAPPVSLSDLIGERVATPPTVRVTVRVTGPAGAPVLRFNGQGGARNERFVRAADGAWEAQMDIPGRGELRIVRFHTRARWHLAPAADQSPRASWDAPISTLSDERVNLSWKARDDFGVRRLVLRVRPLHPPAGLVRADPVDTELEAPAGDPREAEGVSEVDLAAHPYAGMEVEARIVAIDALGQEGVSDPLHFTLPEKVFLQPLARAAIEIRRHILAERRPYRDGPGVQQHRVPAGDILLGNERIEVRDYDSRPALLRAPPGIQRSARLMDALMMAPQDGYFRDLAVYFGFRTARSQLAVARNPDEADIAADTLWRTALRAEYGGAADARRALEEAQRQLAEALAQGAPQERIRQLLEALRRATENYMQALVQEALRNGETAQNQDDTEEQASLSERDIQDMLRRVQELSEQGRNAEAQQLLQQLAQILSNLDVQLSQGGQGEGQEGEGDQQMQQSIDELSETMGEQRALRDETRQEQQQQQGQGGSGGDQQGGEGGDQLAQRQAQLRQGLSEAQRMADEAGAAPSDDLNAAGEAMRQAENALRRGDLEGAEAAQSAALENLRQGADALSAEMRERGRNGQEQGREGGSRDPLGRQTGSGSDDGEGFVPNTADPARAREIFDEIRRRAQDPNRPEAEREYLRRLLDRFSDS
ncbi:MAG: DUF4175 family protein [Hyphomonadaceae bacterium]|nr:DUF4175 family protein [Hyphomonadaceae bacterium]